MKLEVSIYGLRGEQEQPWHSSGITSYHLLGMHHPHTPPNHDGCFRLLLLWMACQRARSYKVLERAPLRQNASTGVGSALIKFLKSATSASLIFPEITGR